MEVSFAFNVQYREVLDDGVLAILSRCDPPFAL
jgi:hypothetical protein